MKLCELIQNFINAGCNFDDEIKFILSDGDNNTTVEDWMITNMTNNGAYELILFKGSDDD